MKHNNTGAGAVGIIIGLVVAVFIFVGGGAYLVAITGMSGPILRVSHLFGFTDGRELVSESIEHFLDQDTVTMRTEMQYIGTTPDQDRSGQLTTNMRIDSEGMPIPGNEQASEIVHNSRVKLETPKETFSGDSMTAEVTYSQLNTPSEIYFRIISGVFHQDFATSELSDPMDRWFSVDPDQRELINETFPSPAFDALAGCENLQAAVDSLANVALSDIATSVEARDGGEMLDELATFKVSIDENAFDEAKDAFLEAGNCTEDNRLAETEFFNIDHVDVTVNLDEKQIVSAAGNVRFKDDQFDGTIQIDTEVYEFNTTSTLEAPEEAMPVTELLEMRE